MWDISEYEVELMPTYGAAMVNDGWCYRKIFFIFRCICVIKFVIILNAGCGGRNTGRFSDALMFRKDSCRLLLLRLRYGL